MNRVSLAAVLLAGAFSLAVPAVAQERSFGRTTTLTMPRQVKLEGVTSADVNGDGRGDLVLAVARRGKRGGRELHVHHRRPTGAGGPAFGADADAVIAVHPDAVAFMLADVVDGPGDDVVLVTRTGAFAVRPQASGRARFPRLVRTDVLWQLPHRRKLIDWSAGVVDLDGDGRDDLLLPRPDGYTVALQRTAGERRAFDVHELELPPAETVVQGRQAARAEGRRSGRSVRLSIGVSTGESSDLVSVEESVPAPRLRDWDGDGDLDVIAQTAAELLAWTADGGGFAAAPRVRIPLPIEVDRRRLLDVSFAADTADVDGDRRSDYLLVVGDRESEDPRAQIALYRQKPGGGALFGKRGRPDQLLVVAGLAAAPRLFDVDGDRAPDLVIGAARFDLLDAVGAATGGSLDAEVYVYANRKGRLTSQPVLTVPISVPAKGLRNARKGVTTRFLGDLTGDGVSEMLVRDDPARVRVHMVRKSGERLQLVDRPLFATPVNERAELVFLGEAGRTELVLFDDDDLLHVRFGQ